MRKFMLIALLAVPFASQAAVENYEIDPLHTFPNFKINHLGYSTMHGRFGKTTGKMTLDRDTMTGSVEITIDAASVDTGFSKRDDHLRSPDFLNAAEFPEITFKASNAKLGKNGTGDIDGTLTIMGVSKPVTLHVTHSHCAFNPMDPKKEKFGCGFDAKTSIKRSDFGVKYGLPAIGDDMMIELELEAKRL